MSAISTGIPAVGPPSGGPPSTPIRASRERDGRADQTLDLSSAFYPFAELSLTESRRQVEAAEAFSEQQAARREQLRDEAREASLKEAQKQGGTSQRAPVSELPLAGDTEAAPPMPQLTAPPETPGEFVQAPVVESEAAEHIDLLA